MKCQTLILVLFLLPVFMPFTIFSQSNPMLKVGLVADPQYADKETVGKRHYRESLWKLQQAIDTFNLESVDFVQNLGDIIDDEWRSFDSILPVYEELQPDIENYQLLGNHDFSIDSSRMARLLDILEMPDFYYSYVRKGWRFIVLDATDYAYYSHSLHHHDTRQIDEYFQQTKAGANHHTWNSAMGPDQQTWLKAQLDSAEIMDEKVILFSHMPIRPLDIAENLWNDREIVRIIEDSSNVFAFINGHNHAGGYIYKNGIHYVTMFGMVDTMISSFGVLEIYEGRALLSGFGNQKTIVLE